MPKPATDLTSTSGLRRRLARFGLDIEESRGTFTVVKPETVATFNTIDALAAFVHGAEVAETLFSAGSITDKDTSDH